MNYKEAIYILENMVVKEDEIVAKEKAIVAMKDQMPLKPIRKTWEDYILQKVLTDFHCGECETIVFMGDRYCPRCGHKIDWTNEEGE